MTYLLVLTALILLGCDGGGSAAAAEESPVTFDSARICVFTASDTLELPVEVARTQEQRAYGLMEREHLAENAGMLFMYPTLQSPASGFWMYRTRIPLDIALPQHRGRDPFHPVHATVCECGSLAVPRLRCRRGLSIRSRGQSRLL